MMHFEIKHRENGHKGSFYIEENGKLLAQLNYAEAGTGRLIIEHTDVSDHLRGHGIGNELVDAIVAFARDRNMKIVPLCAFAKSVFEKTPYYKDVALLD